MSDFWKKLWIFKATFITWFKFRLRVKKYPNNNKYREILKRFERANEIEY